jgi:hypothetical protein
VSIMPVKSPTGRDGAPSHARGVITTVLMIMLAVLIVRDILVRRFGSATQATSDVTQRSR